MSHTPDRVSADLKIMPVMILQTGSMRKSDISRLRKNGICVVEDKNPDSVRFCEPPPLGYSVQEQGAINLFRAIMARRDGKTWARMEIATLYAELLIEGTTLSHIEKVKP